MTFAIELPRSINTPHGGVWARAASERDLDATYLTAADVLAEVRLIEKIRTEEADPYKALRLELQLYRDVLEAYSTMGRGTAMGGAKCAEAALLVNKSDMKHRNGGRRVTPRPSEIKVTGSKLLDSVGHAWTLFPWERQVTLGTPYMYWRRYWRNETRLIVAATVSLGRWEAWNPDVTKDGVESTFDTMGEGKRAADKALYAMVTARH